MPTFSVVVPTRNRVGMLAQTLSTVLTQDVDLEVIVVDEGSTDDTPAFLAALTDPRVRSIRHDRPRGLSNARNAGIEAAHGRWLAFTDDDDLWLPGKLRDQLDAAHTADAAWAYGGALDFKEGPVLLAVHDPGRAATPAHRMAWHNVVPGGGSNVVVAREALDRVGGFDPAHPIVADWDLSIRLLAVGLPAVLSRPVVAYRIHTGNMSNSLEAMLAGMEALEQRYADLRGGEPLDRVVQHRYLAMWAFRNGDRAAARRMALRGFLAGDREAARRLARLTVPLPPRDPLEASTAPRTLLERVAPRRIVPWPAGTREPVEGALATVPSDLCG